MSKRLVLLATLLACLAALLPTSPALASGPVKIAKIHYAQGANLNSEYIVLKNKSSRAVQIKGWEVISAPSTDNQHYFFPRTRIAAGRSVTLYTGFGTNSRGKRYWNSTSPKWNNSGDKAVLKNAAGTTVDTCLYAGGGSGTTAYC